MGHDQFGLSLISGVGDSVAEQGNAGAGALGGLVDASGRYLDAAGRIAAQDRASQRQAAATRAGLRQAGDIFNIGQQQGHVGRYLDLIMGPASTFATTNGQGGAIPWQPTPDPWAAGLGAGLNTLAGSGIFNQNQTWNQPNTAAPAGMMEMPSSEAWQLAQGGG